MGAIPEGKEGVCDFDDGRERASSMRPGSRSSFCPTNELNLSYVFASDEYEGAQARAGDALRILVNGALRADALARPSGVTLHRDP